MSYMMPQSGTAFQYGFLASNVSRILAKYNNNPSYELTPDNKDLLEQATSYIDDLINTQELVLGNRGKQPSSFGFKAFKNAVNSIPKVHIEAKDNPERRKDFFIRLKNAIIKISKDPKNTIDMKDIIIANSFFGIVAELYLQEAERRFKSKPLVRLY